LSQHLITITVLLPVLGALIQAFLPKSLAGDREGMNGGTLGRWLALVCSLGASITAVVLVASMRTQVPDLQASETYPWIGSYAISYDMGLDGLNALLVLLVATLFPILIAAEWNQKTGVRGMHGLFLILQASFFGTVCAQDIFLQFFFWSITCLPFYFLIGIWGGEKRESAAFHSIVSASMGNALVFGALILIYYAVDPHTFSLRELAGGRLNGKVFEILGFDCSVSTVSFILISVGLALRAPIWPLHGWFTRAAKEAPPSVFIALSAVTVPVAIYIFMRLSYSLFPETLPWAGQFIVSVGAINLIMGGVCAVAQNGLRPLMAFICLAEVGFVLVGVGSLSSAGVVGAVYQEMVLGFSVAGFGLFSGIIAERAGNSEFKDVKGLPLLGGIATRAPAIALVAGVIVASVLGFPGSGGFVGHSLMIIGSYAMHPVTLALAGASLLLATYYLFTMYRCLFLGKSSAGAREFADLTMREKTYLLPVVLGLLFCGLYPKPLLELVRPTVLTLLSTVK